MRNNEITVEPLTIRTLAGEWRPLQAAAPGEMLHGCASESSEFAFVEAEAGEGKPKLKKFSGVAYTGGAMLANYGLPVAIDLTGLKASGEQIPALKDHDPTQIVGHQSVEITAQRIKVSGTLSGVGQAAQEVAALSANGYPWQMSVGVHPTNVERIDAGDRANVNGKVIEGPAYVVRAGVLREVSFVAMGADANTSGTVAAAFKEDKTMEFEEWLKARGFDFATLNDEQKATLRAAFHAEKAKTETKVEAKAETKVEAKAGDGVNAGIAELKASMEQLRASLEAERANAAREGVFAKFAAQVDETKLGEIRASATRDNWSADKTELALLRAARPSSFGIHVADTSAPSTEVLTCAMSRTLRHRDVEKRFTPQTLEAADRHFRTGIGVGRLFLMAAAANGMPIGVGTALNASNLRDVLQFAFTPAIRGGFSTVSVSSILENVANKSILEGYMEQDQTWREITRVVPVNDFKDHKAYRLLDDMEYEELTPAGEIKHGTVGDETITRSADTFAKMFALTRKQIINDDLGAFDDLRTRLGRGSAKKFNKVFWAAFLANSSFFTTARTNYIEGSTTNLGTDGVGLGLGVKAFRKMTSPTADGGKLVANDMPPTKLLVPPELEGAAEVLYRNQNLGAVASSSANIYANKYRPIIQARLSDTSYTGYSLTAWYLFGDGMQPMWAAFLNGNEAPTVEIAEADFNTLGVQMRGYHDFGAGLNEYLAGLKSKGAA